MCWDQVYTCSTSEPSYPQSGVLLHRYRYKRMVLYMVTGPDGHPIYIGQTGKLNERVRAHNSGSSSANLRRTIQKLQRTHPRWKVEDNWNPVECVKEGVPRCVIDKYEGFFIAGIENGTDVPGTRQHPDYPLRANAQDGPNWGDYKHMFYEIKADVETAMRTNTQLSLKFQGHEILHIKDPAYKESVQALEIMEALKYQLVVKTTEGRDTGYGASTMEQYGDVDNTVSTLDTRIDLARQTIVLHENGNALNYVIKQSIKMYKNMKDGEDVDSTEFVKIWNSAKAYMQDYLPDAESNSQVFAHALVMQTYKKGIEVIGNGDHSRTLSKRDAIFLLETLKANVAARNSAGGKPAKSFQSMMAWCTFDTKLEKNATVQDKINRLRTHLDNEILSEYQRLDVERRIQEGETRLAAERKESDGSLKTHAGLESCI